MWEHKKTINVGESMINKEIVDEAFEFYEIDAKYKEKSYETLEEISKNKSFTESFNKAFKMLYKDEFSNIKDLWNIKDKNIFFCDSINPFITNLMILSGYKIHKNNMKKYMLDDEQINIHKKRVKECFENDLIIRDVNSIRISQMLWATYFIRLRIIEIGSLQFEYENDKTIKIHIPKNTDFRISKVKESIEESKIRIKEIYNMDNFIYRCNSWLLSNQLHNIIDNNSNISKFYNLFNVSNGDNCISDILNFVYNLDACDNYLNLEENTTLQRIIKQELIKENIFYLGMGILK